MKKYDLITATSMGVRITPADRQPVGIGNHYTMQATSAESNVLNVSASLGLRTRVLTAFVAGSPIASFIKGELRRRNIGYEGPEVEQGGPWGYRHQFNLADSGYGSRGPRVQNDRAGEVGRLLDTKYFDLERIFGAEGVKIGMIRPITLYPFPKMSLDGLDYDKVKGIIDIEMTIPAQMRDDIELQVKGRCPVYEYGRSGGMLLDDEGVLSAIKEFIKEGE